MPHAMRELNVACGVLYLFFFFSSRRRHTRYIGDWSSDVCSSDLATCLAIRDMELAGIDVVTDGEIRRESYSNHFATALEGIDLANPGSVPGRGGRRSEERRVGKECRAREVAGH